MGNPKRERTGVEKFAGVQVMENQGLPEDQQMIQWQRSTAFRREEFGWEWTRWSHSDKARPDHEWPPRPG